MSSPACTSPPSRHAPEPGERPASEEKNVPSGVRARACAWLCLCEGDRRGGEERAGERGKGAGKEKGKRKDEGGKRREKVKGAS